MMTTKSRRQLANGVEVHSFVDEQSSHLVVHEGHGLLVDCHAPDIGDRIDAEDLPVPEIILHTHVQPEHCREADRFPSARIMVHKELVELASDRPAYERAAKTTWDKPEEWPETMGREKYGVAGSVTVLPPEQPLTVAGTFTEGDAIAWRGLVLRVLGLPGHCRRHVGFILESAGASLCLFSGDLLRDPGRVVNMYDLEGHYGGTELPTLAPLLRATAEDGPALYLPATGPVMANGPAQARALADAIDAYHGALNWTSGLYHPPGPLEYPTVGRYVRLMDGVYQIANMGNCILFIDDEGRGMMVDPGPCDYESPTRERSFIEDLEMFERNCGLRTVDLALITHFHGDHIDMTPLLRARYPDCRVAAWDLVAPVVESPDDFPYAARLPWYNVGIDRVAVDDVLHTDEPYSWHDVPIRSGHLPGHCYDHAVYFLTFRGVRIALTGDTIQSHGTADSVSFIMANRSVPDATSGVLKAYRTMVRHEVDLNIGGHGSHFTSCGDMYKESLRRIEHALPYLQAVVPDGNLERAFLRPWWDN